MLGIAIATYNRRQGLSQILKRIRETSDNSIRLVVCNDGSGDSTTQLCVDHDVDFIGESNRGISWNKNRGLFWLMNIVSASRIILIEDDIIIKEDDWLEKWIEAIDLWGHVTWADHGLVWSRHDRFIGGQGLPADPFVLKYVTGQVMAFSREALEKVGYFDSRFRGYGYEHIDLSRRLHRCGYGITESVNVDLGRPEIGYVNIDGGVSVSDLPTVSDRSSTESNRLIYESVRKEGVYREPWINEEERCKFMDEIQSACLRHGRPD